MRRKLRLDQRQQLGEAGGVAGLDKRGQPRNPVDNSEARIDVRAVAGIDAAVDACREREGRPLRKVGIERGDVRFGLSSKRDARTRRCPRSPDNRGKWSSITQNK